MKTWLKTRRKTGFGERLALAAVERGNPPAPNATALADMAAAHTNISHRRRTGS